jgi:ribonuclease P protein component
MPDHSFKKSERLTSRKAITSIFKNGRIQVSPPVRILYQPTREEGNPAVMAVSIPKRNFKRAVDRNLLKRRIREIYRQYKPGFYDQLNQEGIKIHLVIQYQKPEMVSYDTLEKGVQEGLKKVIADLTG